MPTFVPFEPPTTADGRFTALVPDNRILFYRREQLGLTQQQVADMAQIPLRQYQRIEQGDSDLAGNRFECGLAICAALLLDPYALILPDARQADPASMKPVPSLDVNLSGINSTKKVGRKPIRRDIMRVYVNHPRYSIIIPCEVLTALGRPDCIQLLRMQKEKRILIRPIWEGAHEAILSGDAFEVPEPVYDGRVLAFPGENLIENAREDLGWDDEVYCVDCRAVTDHEDNLMALVDLNTASPSDRIPGDYMIPTCIDDGDDE